MDTAEIHDAVGQATLDASVIVMASTCATAQWPVRLANQPGGHNPQRPLLRAAMVHTVPCCCTTGLGDEDATAVEVGTGRVVALALSNAVVTPALAAGDGEVTGVSDCEAWAGTDVLDADVERD